MTADARVTDRSADRLSAELRRASIIEAAWELLKEQGLKAVTIDSVVARIGVSRPIFYRHFEDRPALLTALYDDYADDLAERTLRVLATAENLDDVMVGSLGAYFDCFEDRGPTLRSLIDHVSHYQPLQDSRSKLRQRTMDILTDAVQRVGVRGPRRVIQIHVRLMQGMAMDAASILAAGEGNRREIEEAVLHIQRANVQAFLNEQTSLAASNDQSS